VTWLAKWNVGDVLTAAELNKSMGSLSDTTLGVSAASIDISSLPTTYAHLLLVGQLRSDTAAASTTALLRFNGDTGANYNGETLQGLTASATAVAAGAGTAIQIGPRCRPRPRAPISTGLSRSSFPRTD
jgi:hypothetical protein